MKELPDLPSDPDATIAALRTAHRAMVSVVCTVKPTCAAYHGASMVIAGIDAVGTILTSRLRPFGTSDSAGQRQAEAVEAAWSNKP